MQEYHQEMDEQDPLHAQRESFTFLNMKEKMYCISAGILLVFNPKEYFHYLNKK